MAVLHGRIGGAWVPLASSIVTDQLGAQGLNYKYVKPSNQGGFGGGSEFPISGFESLVMTPLANRYTTVHYGLIISSVAVMPAAPTYIVVSLRDGTGTGTVMEQDIHSWVPSQQSFGAGYISLKGTFSTKSWAANGTATLTLTTFGGMSLALGQYSYLETFDQGSTS